MPVKPTEFCIGETRQRRTFVRQGRLSRHKVSVGEPADGSPPKLKILKILTKLFFDDQNLKLELKLYSHTSS